MIGPITDATRQGLSRLTGTPHAQWSRMLKNNLQKRWGKGVWSHWASPLWEQWSALLTLMKPQGNTRCRWRWQGLSKTQQSNSLKMGSNLLQSASRKRRAQSKVLSTRGPQWPARVTSLEAMWNLAQFPCQFSSQILTPLVVRKTAVKNCFLTRTADIKS